MIVEKRLTYFILVLVFIHYQDSKKLDKTQK